MVNNKLDYKYKRWSFNFRDVKLMACAFALLCLLGCSETPRDAIRAESLPPMYPDYEGVTVPVNIAPLNFLLRDDCEAVYAEAKGLAGVISISGHGNEIKFGPKQWHRFLEMHQDQGFLITVSAKKDGQWIEYDPISINVSGDSIDPYLTYRLIEPDYEIFSRLQIRERCVEDFSERTLCDYNMVGNRCMNCHTYGAGRPDRSFLYVRGEGGGIILNDAGQLRKLGLRTDDMVSGSVYAQFSPSGRWLVFSTNVIIPGFHANPSKRLEVFDTKSDVYVADLANNTIVANPILADSLTLETFPTFSPDGKSIYYCAAQWKPNPATIDSLQYSLCSIDFDEATGRVGEKIDTIVEARLGEKRSVCHPRVSPDGRYLLYTVADYGTFPIWHRESDQQMIDLTTGEINEMARANSDQSDTYHSWSSNGRWFVFASKRDDGLYGKPYFCHVSETGEVGKPFVLPQRQPTFYDANLKSFNAPELGRGQVHFNAADVAAAMELPAETFTVAD